MQQKPALGRNVLVKVDPVQNNGSDTAPAMITRVWGSGKVNVRVFLDTFTMPLSLTSVHLFEAEDMAMLHEAYWPPRV